MLKRLLKKKHSRKSLQPSSNPDNDMSNVNGLSYWKFLQLLELSSALETLLSSSFAKSASKFVNIASSEFAQAIGFTSSTETEAAIISQLLRVTTSIAHDFYELGGNFDSIEECILSSLAISIYLLVTDSVNSFSFLYDMYCLPGSNTLTIHDVTVLLHDTIKSNHHSRGKKGKKIKIAEITNDMINFKKATDAALTPIARVASTSSETFSETSLSLSLEEFLKVKFNNYMKLRTPPIEEYIFLLDRFQIALLGKDAWKVVKKMNKKGHNKSSDAFSVAHTRLLSDFCIFMKKIEAKMHSSKIK